MKRSRTVLRFQWTTVLWSEFQRRTWILAVGLCLITGLWIGIPCACAEFLSVAEIALISYHDQARPPEWLGDEAFSQVLARDLYTYALAQSARESRFVVIAPIEVLQHEIKITFSPRVILKPVIIVEELQDLFSVYQSQKYEKNFPMNEHLQSKNRFARTPATKNARLKKVYKPKIVVVSPYYNRIYGLHLQISW